MIYVFQDKYVMIDRDLAGLYQIKRAFELQR